MNCQDRSRLLSKCLCNAVQYSGMQCFALLCIILKYLTWHMTSHVYCIFYLCFPPMSPSPLSLVPPLWQCICCYDGNASSLIKLYVLYLENNLGLSWSHLNVLVVTFFWPFCSFEYDIYIYFYIIFRCKKYFYFLKFIDLVWY